MEKVVIFKTPEAFLVLGGHPDCQGVNDRLLEGVVKEVWLRDVSDGVLDPLLPSLVLRVDQPLLRAGHHPL
jgi:hypothetical protein